MNQTQTDHVNTNVLEAKYAVMGKLYQTAQKRLQDGKAVVFTNVGNPHGLGQHPLTFIRQVLSLVMNPKLLEKEAILQIYPSDVIHRAKEYLSMCKGNSVGAYTDAKGIPGVRQQVAQFIETRDKFPANPDNIFITDGASSIVRAFFRCLIRSAADGILVPLPQYPLYSASITMNGGTILNYELDESNGWSLDLKKLAKQVKSARQSGINVRCMIVINPGNPTGHTLRVSEQENIVKFCAEEGIVLVADEVYQENIYNMNRKFTSFHQVVKQGPYSNDIELVSLHSASKGSIGECGLRGGYMHLLNVNPLFQQQLYKYLAVSLSPNVIGNILVGLMCKPPCDGDPSFELYTRESGSIIESMSRRAKKIERAFNSCEGISCEPTDGAMYSFPKIALPQSAIDQARACNMEPDVFYCLALLNETGISTVPGSGFGQKEGEFHFRTTILPLERDLDEILSSFQKFHRGFMCKYRSRGQSTVARL
eukprot:g5137.t1